MRQIVVFSILFLVLPLVSFGQPSGGFDYQALVYESGAPLSERSVLVKIALQDGAGQVYYEEEHESLQTDKLGLLRVPVGGGKVLVGSFGSVPWEKGILVGASLNTGAGYRSLGPAVQLQSVPYALRTRSNPTLRGTATNRAQDTPIFEVVNSQGKSVFAVYEEGVALRVAGDADEATRKGGLSIATRKVDGSDRVERLHLDRGFRAQVDEETGRGVRGGFAVATYSDALRSGAKQPAERMWVSGPGVGVSLDAGGLRGVRGGFAVSRRTPSGERNAFSVQSGAVESWVDPVERGVRGGFAVALRSASLRDDEFEHEDSVQTLLRLDDRNAYLTVSGRMGGEGVFSFRTRDEALAPLVSISSTGQIVTRDGRSDQVFMKMPQMTSFATTWASEGVLDPSVGALVLKLSNAVRAAHPIGPMESIPGGTTTHRRLGLELDASDPLFEGLEVQGVYPFNGSDETLVGLGLKPGYVIKEARTIPAEKVEAALVVYMQDNPMLRHAVRNVSIELQPTMLSTIGPVSVVVHDNHPGRPAEADVWLEPDHATGASEQQLVAHYRGLMNNTFFYLKSSDDRLEFYEAGTVNRSAKGRIVKLEEFFRDGGTSKPSSHQPGKYDWMKKIKLKMSSPSMAEEKEFEVDVRGTFDFQ